MSLWLYNFCTCPIGTHVYSAYPPSNTRPIPPMAVATMSPCWNWGVFSFSSFSFSLTGADAAGAGAEATMPVASIPRIRGNCTGLWPWRVKSSERLRPKALMRMRTWPGWGMGMGRFFWGVLVWGDCLFWGEVEWCWGFSFFCFFFSFFCLNIGTYLFYLEHFRAAGLMDYNCFHHLLSMVSQLDNFR